MELFESARTHLLKQQDEREAVIRLCRDINSYSKKVIFSFHRVNNGNISLSLYNEVVGYINIISKRLHTVWTKYSDSTNFSNLKSSISNAIEEMIEAFTFMYFVMNKKLLTYEKMMEMIGWFIRGEDDMNVNLIHYGLRTVLFENRVSEEILNEMQRVETGPEEEDFFSNPGFWTEQIHPLPEDCLINFIYLGDYFLGLFDLTGEIMRYTITNLVDEQSKTLNKDSLQNLVFMNELYKKMLELFDDYSNLDVRKGIFNSGEGVGNNSSLKKKLDVFKQSLKKVESTVCGMLIRGREYTAQSMDIRAE